ncbi:regulatory associated protein of TOR, partial [Kipferlia bialata]
DGPSLRHRPDPYEHSQGEHSDSQDTDHDAHRHGSGRRHHSRVSDSHTSRSGQLELRPRLLLCCHRHDYNSLYLQRVKAPAPLPSEQLGAGRSTGSVTVVGCIQMRETNHNDGKTPAQREREREREREKMDKEKTPVMTIGWTDIRGGEEGSKLVKQVEPALCNIMDQYKNMAGGQSRATALRLKAKGDFHPDSLSKANQSNRRAIGRQRAVVHVLQIGFPAPLSRGHLYLAAKSGGGMYSRVSVRDLRDQIGTPATYVFDCNQAGLIMEGFKDVIEGPDPDPGVVVFAACGGSEQTPRIKGVPADLLTCCLTAPVRSALTYTLATSHAHMQLSPLLQKHKDSLFGDADLRKGLVRLQGVYNAIADTIAFDCIQDPQEFRRVFRTENVTMSLFRHSLLAQRVLSVHGSTLQTVPALPDMTRHPYWRVWEELLSGVISDFQNFIDTDGDAAASRFFNTELDAFRGWMGVFRPTNTPSIRLPVVIYALSQNSLRVQALQLVAQFLDTGPQAVRQALELSLTYFMRKLIVRSGADSAQLEQCLVFIWSKIISTVPAVVKSLMRKDPSS